MELEWNIIKRFSQKESACFSTDDAQKEFSKTSPTHLANTLARMVKRNMLIRLRRGLYYIVPLEHNDSQYIPNWHMVSRCLMRGKNYYIGYSSALHIHKLITQPSTTEIIVTDTQIKPGNIEIQGVRFQFIHHKTGRFFGIENTWIDDFNKVQCSDLEKTLVDSFINPHYSNGMVEIAKALYESKDKTDQGKMVDYFTRSGSKVAARRYVFICDLLEISSSHHEGLLKNNLSGSFQRLDTSAPDEGRIDTRYGLKINRDVNTIKEARYT